VVWCNTEGEGVMWCDGGGRQWWVLTTWVVVVVCGCVVSICGRSFLNVGGRSHTWVVVVWWWWWQSAVASLSTWLPRCCQRRGTWLPCQQRKWGEGCVWTVGTGWRCLPGAGHGAVTIRRLLTCHDIVVASH